MEKLKVMIADNNPVLLQQLAERISRDNCMELVGIVDNGRDACEIIKREEPNIVVFDMLMPYYDGFTLLDKVKNQKGDNERQKFIMTTPLADDVIAKESYRRGADYIIIKPYDVEMMADKIRGVWAVMNKREQTDNLNNSLDFIISKKLNHIGIPASLKGYRYMITALKEVLKDETVLEGITKVLYPEVAKRHNSTPQRVEKAIRHSIEVAWERNGGYKMKEEFKYLKGSGKARPTNSEFIAVVSQRIRMSI